MKRATILIISMGLITLLSSCALVNMIADKVVERTNQRIAENGGDPNSPTSQQILDVSKTKLNEGLAQGLPMEQIIVNIIGAILLVVAGATAKVYQSKNSNTQKVALAMSKTLEEHKNEKIVETVQAEALKLGVLTNLTDFYHKNVKKEGE